MTSVFGNTPGFLHQIQSLKQTKNVLYQALPVHCPAFALLGCIVSKTKKLWNFDIFKESAFLADSGLYIGISVCVFFLSPPCILNRAELRLLMKEVIPKIAKLRTKIFFVLFWGKYCVFYSCYHQTPKNFQSRCSCIKWWSCDRWFMTVDMWHIIFFSFFIIVWYYCYYLHTLRFSVSPICVIF